ncbi:putative ATPase, AAA-type, core, P-loop containing nucleoside triphosphate hydrolase [Helianthus anomalus]
MIAIDSDLKKKVKSDLESFLKSKQYYNQLGRVWKRSYLLYGPSGTRKSGFIAAKAKHLSYDIYDIDLSKVVHDSDLEMLLLQTTSKSIIFAEDLDRFISSNSNYISSNSNYYRVTLSGILNFVEGILNSCCGEEKLMVFTMNSKDNVDSAIFMANSNMFPTVS